MHVVTSDQMRRIEERLFESVPSIQVMERAGRLLAQHAASLSAGPFAVVCGKGNNGGDGLVAARYLHREGRAVVVVMTATPESLSPDAAINLGLAREEGISFLSVIPWETDLVVDCILGTGVRGEPRSAARDLIALVCQSGRRVLAADLPSGVDADTGQVPGIAVRADYTLAIGLPKWSHFLYPGALRTGELAVADIGLEAGAITAEAPHGVITTGAAVRGWLPAYGLETHKGTRGRVLVVGGAPGMSGAPALSGMAALRSGAGLVKVAVPEAIQPLVAALAAEYTTATFSNLEQRVPQVDAVAIGPGLGTAPEVQEAARRWVLSSGAPVVLDADGLRAFAGAPAALHQARAPVILTPHPGEMAALLQSTVPEIQADRLGAASHLAAVTGSVVVCKGAYTLISTPGGELYVNPTGNRALATGGSGDVLTGVIAGLLAQGLAPAQAAAAGVYLHGLAADRWAAVNGLDGMLAGDLLPLLPLAQRDVRAGKGPALPVVAPRL